jgi:hypothetical protein
LIVLNASIFASSFSDTMKYGLPSSFFGAVSYILCGLGTRFIHTIPEVSSYFLVAIAGGVLSKAVTKEKILSKRFNKVVKDSLILFGIALIIIVVAALLESKVTGLLIVKDICSNYALLILTIFLIVGIVVFELKRKRIKHS